MTRHPLQSPGSRRPAALAALLAALALLAPAAAPVGDEEALEGARAALEKWVETRRVISKEKQDWALGKELLDERVALVQREIETLGGRIADAEASIAEADKKRADLLAENERLEQLAAGLAERVVGLEDRTRQLLRRLPDPIRERVKPLSQRLPEAGAESKLSLSERFQNVVGILNEVDKFNRDVTVTSEVRTLPDGTTVEVTALYAGIGQGWYASANGQAAGIGAPSEEGWSWQVADAAAPDIARAIAILENEQVAAFVQLPVRVEPQSSTP